MYITDEKELSFQQERFKARVWDLTKRKMYLELNAWRIQDVNNFPPSVLVKDGSAEKRIEHFVIMPIIKELIDYNGNNVYVNDILEFSNGQKWLVVGYEISGLSMLRLDDNYWEDRLKGKKTIPSFSTFDKITLGSKRLTYYVVGNSFESNEHLPIGFSEVGND